MCKAKKNASGSERARAHNLCVWWVWPYRVTHVC